MTSLTKAFQERKKKELSHGEVQPGGYGVVASMPTSAVGKQQVLAALAEAVDEDVAALKLIQSIKEKELVKKKTLIPKYLDAIRGLMAAESDHPLLGQILVWVFDAKDIPLAMDLAEHCIAHKVPMPERFRRSLEVFLCDTVLDWTEAEHDAHRSCEPYFSRICTLAEGWDMPDEVRARLRRLSGLIALDREDYVLAVKELKVALEYGAKVKTALKKAEKKLKQSKEDN